MRKCKHKKICLFPHNSGKLSD